eukprot:2259198-Pleurochrysis_carterae.AAC.2
MLALEVVVSANVGDGEEPIGLERRKWAKNGSAGVLQWWGSPVSASVRAAVSANRMNWPAIDKSSKHASIKRLSECSERERERAGA